MQAIVTKFHAPTNFSGARYSARAAAGRVIVHADYSMNFADNHKKAAETLAKKLGWEGRWIAGGMPNEDGYVFVNVDSARDGAFNIKPTI